MTKTKSQHNFYLSEETRRMLNTIKAFRNDATIDDTLAYIASVKINEILATRFVITVLFIIKFLLLIKKL